MTVNNDGAQSLPYFPSRSINHNDPDRPYESPFVRRGAIALRLALFIELKGMAVHADFVSEL
jgi:hypothetical protein